MAATNVTIGSESVFQAICSLLDKNQVKYKQLEHERTLTSEESAKVRGEDLSIGGKAILMKVDDTFRLFVLSASKKLNSKKVKEHFKAKKIRFANQDELLNLTGLVPGSVPPFGKEILPFELYLDELTGKQNERIAFNAGLLTKSIIMNMSDYLKVAMPVMFDFSEWNEWMKFYFNKKNKKKLIIIVIVILRVKHNNKDKELEKNYSHLFYSLIKWILFNWEVPNRLQSKKS